MDLEFYLKEINFDKQFKKLTKKLKNKKVIIYGSGSLFQLIQEKYDLSKLNIIGISDRKYTPTDEGNEDLGYKIIPMVKMPDYSPDYVLVSTLNYIDIIDNFESVLFKGEKTKIRPLAQKGFWTSIKEIWEIK